MAHGDELMLQQSFRCYTLSSINVKHQLKHVHKHKHIIHFCQGVRGKMKNKLMHLIRTRVKAKVTSQDAASGQKAFTATVNPKKENSPVAGLLKT